jgi:hypothetical protein
MTAEQLAQWFRRFLLMLVVCLCLGTVVELVLQGHYKEPTQLIPFGLAGVGLLSVLSVLLKPQRTTLMALRVVMIVVILGSLLGGVLHFVANYEFAAEIRPNAAVLDTVWEAATGASPLLAPGLLAVAGILALAATYYHPALRR